MGEEGSGEGGQEVWAQWNVIMDDDVMLRVISYGFSDATISSCCFVRSRGLTTMTVEVGWRAGVEHRKRRASEHSRAIFRRLLAELRRRPCRKRTPTLPGTASACPSTVYIQAL